MVAAKPVVRKLVAARLDRVLKHSRLPQRKAPLAKRQPAHSIANEEESTKLLRRRRNQENKNKRLSMLSGIGL
ncbi:MAG: hypothetical protein AUI05_03505 [Verrucomicrobia bacterium 13_2_20CM_2_54_15_9cls]|nr:MAG: hypothetical protein AUI05_03505 [Verrucomicrobia bacterium 13_2_20CM_2_54_15_9cls]